MLAPRRRAASAAGAVLALVILGAGCGGGDGDAPSAATASSPSTSASPSAHSSGSSTAGSTPTSPSSTPTSPVRALFFGDSYVVGGPYAPQEESMAALAARRLGWEAQIRGGGGTGFTQSNPEYDLGTFLEQAQAGALDVGPVDWLVVEGGSNDEPATQPQLLEAAVATLRYAAEQHPEARIVLVGTFDATVDDFSDTDPVIATLRRAAAETGVDFVDAQRWLEGRQDLVGPDFDHPLPAGQRLVGRRLAEALQALADPA